MAVGQIADVLPPGKFGYESLHHPYLRIDPGIAHERTPPDHHQAEYPVVAVDEQITVVVVLAG